MKKLVSLLIIVALALPITGCLQGKPVINFFTGACDWLEVYQPKAQAALTTIQANYDVYYNIIIGVVPVTAPVLETAKAWIAAADVALAVFGKVTTGVCDMLSEAQVQEAIMVYSTTLPATAIAPVELHSYKMKLKTIRGM